MADENKTAEERVESGWASPEEAQPETDTTSSDEMQKSLARPSAEDIYKQVAKNAQEELKRSSVWGFRRWVSGWCWPSWAACGAHSC
jgi:hypothetical protein